MNFITQTIQNSMTHYLFKGLLFTFFTLLLSCSVLEKSLPTFTLDKTLGLAVFASPEDAANIFTQSLQDQNITLLKKLFGNNYVDILPIENLTHEDINNFIKAWKANHHLVTVSQSKKLIAVGKDNWTFPIPIISSPAGWHFDINEGLDRIRIRRIGRNELNVMQAVLAYYDAQMEYITKDHNHNGTLEYAQKFISSPGKKEGLFWETNPDETPSPLGPLFADHQATNNYHGYFYKIIKAQGKHAKNGAYSYLSDQKMTKGFALLAWPEKYNETGIMSFIVNHEGIVYEQNLGANSSQIAKEISVFNPDTNWLAIKEAYTN